MSGALQAVFQNLRSFGGTFVNWIALLGTNANTNSYGKAIAIDSSGNSYVGGITYGSSGFNTIQLAKYDEKGTIQWQRKLDRAGTNNEEECWDLTIDSSNNIYLCAYAVDVNGFSDLIVAKYNSSGTLQWQRRLIGTNPYLFGWGIGLDSSNNIFIGGQTRNGSNTDALLVKYNSSGALQWQRQLASSEYDVFNDAAADSAGNGYACGFTTLSFGWANGLLAKYNSSGTIQWQRQLANTTTRDLIFNKMAIDSSDNIYITGYYGDSVGSPNIILIKYNSSGTLQWQRALAPALTNSSVGLGIKTDASGNIYITGYGNEGTYGSENILIAKYNSSGTLQWQRDLLLTSQSYPQYGSGVFPNATDVYMVGQSQSRNFWDFIIAKLPNDGSLTGSYLIGSTSMTYAVATYTDVTTTFTSSTASLTNSTPTNTDSAGILTDSATSLVSTVGSL